MEQFFSKKNVIILIFISLAVLIGLMTLLRILNNANRHQEIPAPTPVNFPTPTAVEQQNTSPPPHELILPKSVEEVPTLSPDKGLGVDTQSDSVQASIRELEKIYPYLPYSVEYKLSTGLNVSIVIPGKEMQANFWTLTVQIFGIEYEVPPGSPEYQNMRDSFREAANTIFDWLKSNDVDPTNLIVTWGDKVLIQEKAREWLR